MTAQEREEMILQNAPLVTTVCKRVYCSPWAYYDRSDMFQEGMIGLMKAVDRFDPDKGFAFSTYAVPLIQGEIMRFVRDNAQSLRYSRSDVDALHRLNRSGKSIDELTAQDVEELGLTPKNIAAIRSMTTVSIHARLKDEGYSTFEEIIPNESNSDVSENLQLEIIENIKNLVIARFNPRKQDLADEWYYSRTLGIKPGQTYLARKYNISQAQVSREIKDFKNKFAKKLEQSGYTVPDYLNSTEVDFDKYA